MSQVQPRVSPSGEPSDQLVRAQLFRILSSELFSRSDRLSAFLKFIVDETLNGRGDTLKEQVIATELYGKGADFNSAADPIVRVDARRLRDRLREYYASALHDPLVISVPKGSYTPAFEVHAFAGTATAADAASVRGERVARSRRRFELGGAALVLVGAAAIAILWPIVRSGSRGDDIPRTLAILPFKPLVAAARDEALELGVTETLINRLSQGSRVIVRPLSAVRRYTDLAQDPLAAGRALGVDAVLEGSIQHAGDTTRVSARLLDVRDGSTRLALRESAASTNLLALQDVIAERVASALTVTLSVDDRRLARQHTTNPDAYLAYLRGRHRLWRRTMPDNRRALELFQEAIALDPSYAHAHAGLAEAYAALAFQLGARPHDVMPKAREAAFRALELDGSLAEAHTSLALVRGLYDYDWEGAEVEHRRAIALNPRGTEALYWYANLLRAVGRFDEAVVLFERARDIDPLSAEIQRGIAHVSYAARRFDAAIEQSLKTLDLDPTFGAGYWVLARAYEAKGLQDQAIEALLNLHGTPPAGPVSLDDPTRNIADEVSTLRAAYADAGWIGYWRMRLRFADNAASYPSFQRAEIHVRLGETEKALGFLEKAYEERSGYFHQLKTHAVWDALRHDSRFDALLRRARLGPSPRATTIATADR